MISNWESLANWLTFFNNAGISFVFEIDGCACGNSILDSTPIEGSGTHTVQIIPGFVFSPGASVSIEAGFRATVLSRGANAEYCYGPVFGMKQKL